jgi:hypothetical protein
MFVRGVVSAEPETVDGEHALALDTEAMVRSFDDLSGRTRFGGALVINQDDAGNHHLAAITPDHADIHLLEGIQGPIEQLRSVLEKVVAGGRSSQSLESEATRKLLVNLAQQGRTIRDAIVEDYENGEAIAAAERLQILAARPESYFPLEFVYDGVFPEDSAPLCRNAKRALGSGVCEVCPSKTDGKVICPLGFWGLSKIIERHAHTARADDDLRADFRIDPSPERGRKRLPELRSAVFAAHDQVDKVKRGTRDDLCARIAAATGSPIAREPSWSAWREVVDERDPPLLVLLPHVQITDNELPALFIESEQELAVGAIDPRYVGEGSPVVLLLGCSTGDPTVPFQAAPAAFRRKGAAIVLATLTKVMGRHAARIAGDIVELLAQFGPERQTTFGEVMRSVKRKLVAEGIVTALVLTAYGDADWMLGGRTP